MGKNLSFYEQTRIMIPGAPMVFGLLFFFAEFRMLFFSDGVSIGGLGLCLLSSYAAGHLAGGVGNIMESCVWFGRGRPSNWVVAEKNPLLSSQQIGSLEQLIRQRLRLDISSIRGMDHKQWFPISRQIYADVMSHGKPARIDRFDGNYTLNRGLAAAVLALVLISLAFSETDWRGHPGPVPLAAHYTRPPFRVRA